MDQAAPTVPKEFGQRLGSRRVLGVDLDVFLGQVTSPCSAGSGPDMEVDRDIDFRRTHRFADCLYIKIDPGPSGHNSMPSNRDLDQVLTNRSARVTHRRDDA